MIGPIKARPPRRPRALPWIVSRVLVISLTSAGGFSIVLAGDANGSSAGAATAGTADAPSTPSQRSSHGSGEQSTQQSGQQSGQPSTLSPGYAESSAVDEDQMLERRMERRLDWDAKLAAYDLDVKVNNSIANLSGSVATIAESHRARRIADETEGVGGVVNALYVDPALIPFDERSPERPDDAELTKRLEIALAHEPDLAHADVQVEVDDGIVRLSGTAGDYTSEMRAKRVAESLFGVERVKSDLEVVAQ